MAGIDIISDSTGKEIVAAIQSTDVAQARISEINAAAEAKKNEVLESIPEDYSNIVNDISELKGDLDYLIDYTKEIIDNTSSYLMDNTAYTKTGGFVTSANYKTFAWIPVRKDDVILYTGANGTNTDIGLINGYYNGSKENFISNLLQVVSGENSSNKLIKITNEKVKFITASFRTAENVSYSLVIYRKNKRVITDYSHLFNKVACIGDSLTRGYYVNSQSEGVDGSPHYPYFLAKMNNWQFINAGVSGATPQTWLQNSYVTSLDYSSCDICFICFGRNGNIEDGEYRDYYKNLIDWLRERNNSMIIFLISVPFTDSSTESLNVKQEYIQQIATDKNCYYLDTNTIMYPQDGAIYRPNDGIHYNRIGYYTRALEINNAFNEWMNSNLDKFTQWLQN